MVRTPGGSAEVRRLMLRVGSVARMTMRGQVLVADGVRRCSVVMPEIRAPRLGSRPSRHTSCQSARLTTT